MAHHNKQTTTAEHEENVLMAFTNAVNAASTLQAQLWLANISAGKQFNMVSGDFADVPPASIVLGMLDGISFDELMETTVQALKTLQSTAAALRQIKHQCMK